MGTKYDILMGPCPCCGQFVGLDKDGMVYHPRIEWFDLHPSLEECGSRIFVPGSHFPAPLPDGDYLLNGYACRFCHTLLVAVVKDNTFIRFATVSRGKTPAAVGPLLYWGPPSVR